MRGHEAIEWVLKCLSSCDELALILTQDIALGNGPTPLVNASHVEENSR